MILPKFVREVTKFVFYVTTISQDYICIWQSSIIYIRAANKRLPRHSVLLTEKAVTYILQHELYVKVFDCNTIKTSLSFLSHI